MICRFVRKWLLRLKAFAVKIGEVGKIGKIGKANHAFFKALLFFKCRWVR